MELYAVVWDDAHGSDGTLAAHEIDHKPYRYTTVGFFVKSDAVGVSIAFERGEDGKFRDITFVPRSIVVEEFSLGRLRRPRRVKLLEGETSAPKL
jgi:hypothetical protein